MREAIAKKRAQGFLVTNLINVRYLCGFCGSSGFIVITKKKNIFITDFRYKEAAERELGSTGIDWDLRIERGDRLKVIKHLMRSLGIGALGFESSVSYEFFRGLSRSGAELKPLREIVETLRAVKDKEEIRLLRAAIKRAEAAFLDVKPYVKEGKRERDIALRIEERLKKRGCHGIPFDIIVASGINSALPHARATEKKLSAGDLVVIDWGGEAEGYCSDMTRTFLVGTSSPGRRGTGERADISKKWDIFRSVLKANREAVSSVMPGAEGRVIDSAARNSIKKAGYAEFFGHGTGHGVGLEVHESPRISWTKSETIRANMVFTIEPGIYIPGLGGVRIEDMVLVKPGGCEVLTRLPKKLEIL